MVFNADDLAHLVVYLISQITYRNNKSNVLNKIEYDTTVEKFSTVHLAYTIPTPHSLHCDSFCSQLPLFNFGQLDVSSISS